MANVENDRQYVTEGTDEFKTAPKRAKILKCNKQLHAVQILLAAAFVAITSVSHGVKPSWNPPAVAQTAKHTYC